MRDALQELVMRAQAGDATALPRIREILDKHTEIWKHAGDMSGWVERAWIAVIANNDPLVVESMNRTIAEMKAELQGESPTALERMLVNQVISCWLEVKYAESISARENLVLEQSAFRLKRLESAQRRHLIVIQTLTTLRKTMPAGLAPSGSIKLFTEPDSKQA